MGEPETGARPLVGNRILTIAVSAVLLFIFIFIIWSLRGCIPSVAKDKGYTKIYSNLELDDTAKVITRLKELKIQYEVQEKGTAVSVPKEKADDARLGLAEKNLPSGGMVGWEIFNEARMGATDFDRRIQMVRAISGELSRNIRRIAGVEDARVQVVIPETQLFQVTKSPVTAAVLIKLSPGAKLRAEQIAGIVHLTSSSVENLQPENVTVVDENGNILSQKAVVTVGQPRMITELPPPVQTVEAAPVTGENIIKKAASTADVKPVAAPLTGTPTQAAVKKEEKVARPPLTAEEKTLLKLKAKEEYERQLTAKIQDILNQFYPPNGVITKVSIDFGVPSSGKTSNLKIKSNSEFLVQPIKMIKIFVLVDNRVNLTPKLKKNTYQTVAEVVAYNSKRGDKIILKKVPFHYATTPPIPRKPRSIMQMIPMRSTLVMAIFALAGLVLVLIILYLIRPRKEKKTPFENRGLDAASAGPTESEAVSVIDEIKNMAGNNPERIANLLKKWLTEE